MSSTSPVKLTEEQQKFLESLEEEFKDRYTEKDEEFKATMNEILPPPPIVENWNSFGDRRWSDRRHYVEREWYTHPSGHRGRKPSHYNSFRAY